MRRRYILFIFKLVFSSSGLTTKYIGDIKKVDF